jgi:short-subunit dehydrogenase
MRKMRKIKGKRILITGASSGIGKAMAMECARRGAVLALAARGEERLKQVGDEIRISFPQVPSPLIFPCDVVKKKEVDCLLEQCAKKMGNVDILICNAGAGVYGSTERTVSSDYEWIMDVNFFGTVHCLLSVIPLMKHAGEGLIVCVSSVAALHGVPYLGAYSASKAAVAALCQSLEAELHHLGIKLMVVFPGYTQTEFFQKEKMVGGGRRPAGPYAPPEKVARSIIEAVEKGKRQLVLSWAGKALYSTRALFPGLVAWAMRKIAARLKDSKEDQNEQTKIADHRSFSESG